MITFFLFTLIFALAVFFLLLFVSKERRENRLKAGISDAGFETAYDLVFPLKRKIRLRRFGTGPVLPR